MNERTRGDTTKSKIDAQNSSRIGMHRRSAADNNNEINKVLHSSVFLASPPSLLLPLMSCLVRIEGIYEQMGEGKMDERRRIRQTKRAAAAAAAAKMW